MKLKGQMLSQGTSAKFHTLQLREGIDTAQVRRGGTGGVFSTLQIILITAEKLSAELP